MDMLGFFFTGFLPCVFLVYLEDSPCLFYQLGRFVKTRSHSFKRTKRDFIKSASGYCSYIYKYID